MHSSPRQTGGKAPHGEGSIPERQAGLLVFTGQGVSLR